MTERSKIRRGFTLIELLVVIAIIALLIGILLPALGKARESGRALKASANERNVAQAIFIYTNDNGDLIPPSYVYGDSKDGSSWRPEDQILENPNAEFGYIHWSYALFNNGEVPQDAFECPTTLNGGAPRTNPGNDPLDWEEGQVNDVGTPAPGDITPKDRQVPRMAFTGNQALFPRNKFNVPGSVSQRRNRLVKISEPTFSSSTILMTEFDDRKGWSAISDQVDGEGETGWKSKSHRSITPFTTFGAGGEPATDAEIFNVAINKARPSFTYVYTANIFSPGDSGYAGNTLTSAPISAVGWHHGNRVNFAYVDGHVELENLKDTVREGKWGDRFYSVTGPNKVLTPEYLKKEGVWKD